MEQIHYLSRKQLAAVAYPLRQKVLDLLVERGELSGREIVELIPGAPSNPYYHLDVLRKARLIKVVRTVPRRGVTEKYYAAVARTFSLRPEELLGTRGRRGRPVREGVVSVARHGAESALTDLTRALETGGTGGGGEEPLINLCRLRLSPERAEALRAQLSACLTTALEEAHSSAVDAAGRQYVFYQLLFPQGKE